MRRIALLAAALVALGAPAFAADDRAGEPPLVLASEGAFYVGGHTVQENGQPVLVDDMFVEYQVPAQQTHPYPLVMVHGGGGSGDIWLATPDGREGWAEYFLRRGWAVYIVDSPAVGRSNYDPVTDGPRVSAPPTSASQMFTASQDYNLWPQAKLHTQFPGTGLPGDATYDQFAHGLHASINGGVRMDTINRDALAALLDKIGPAVLLTHSRSGPFGWLAADARPGLVKGIVAVEPNGPVFKNNQATAANGPPAVDRAWGITFEKMTFDPPVNDPAELMPVQDPPEAPGLLGCWRIGGAPRTLPHLKGVPILIATSEAGYHTQYDQCTSEFLTHAGVANEHIRLANVGIHGNGHLMMLEKNSLQIAGVIDSWLDQHVH